MINKNFKDWTKPNNGIYQFYNNKTYIKSTSSESTAFKCNVLSKQGDEYTLKLKVKVINGSCVVKFTHSDTNSTIYNTHIIKHSGTHIIKTIVPPPGTMCVHIGSPGGYESELEIYDILEINNDFTQNLKSYSKFKLRLTNDGSIYKSNSFDNINIEVDKSYYDSSNKKYNLFIKCNELNFSKRPSVIMVVTNEDENSNKFYLTNTLTNYYEEGSLVVPFKLIELTDSYRVGLPKGDVFLTCVVI